MPENPHLSHIKIVRKKWVLKKNSESFYLILPSFSSFIPIVLGPTSLLALLPFLSGCGDL